MVLTHFTAPMLTSTEAPVFPPRTSVKKPPIERDRTDPNVADPRFNVNRPCIYERRLPRNAYITAHVQRLQHGYYSTPVVSDMGFDHVDFLAVNFVFHSPNTLNHRFKAATIRASLYSPPIPYSSHRDRSNRNSRLGSRCRPLHPRFLMHAPHLLYGSISPETMQWSHSLSGTLGIAQLPLIASLTPSTGLNGQFRRFEMMRIQGSARTLDDDDGNTRPAAQIVWTLEENSLQRSGLPREFTFAMLIAKPSPCARVVLDLEIDPILQSWFGAYPTWWLALWKRYRAVQRRRMGQACNGSAIDFRASVGQTFEPVTSRRGFNFATLVGGFDEFVSLAGRRVMLNIPGENFQDDTDGAPPITLPQPQPQPQPYPYPMPYPGFGYGYPNQEGAQVTVPLAREAEPGSRPRDRVRKEPPPSSPSVHARAHSHSYEPIGTGSPNSRSNRTGISSGVRRREQLGRS
ncbi:hypothetical protein BJX66DRAFT_343052 [Aspergillus keveii]|uniref:Uncharacterized protein n=1 Tax=Aspergillus keveii TaxID=714993 RepID=A0ABR4FQE9_9EURO